MVALLVSLAFVLALSLALAQPDAPVPPAIRTGRDQDGHTWVAERIGNTMIHIRRDDAVWVDRCGPNTLADVTRRHGIEWLGL